MPYRPLSIALAAVFVLLCGLLAPGLGPAAGHEAGPAAPAVTTTVPSALALCVRGTPRARAGERRLRRVEELTLGPDHAHEHALQRRRDRRVACARRLGLIPKAAVTRRARISHALGSPGQVGAWSAPIGTDVVGIHASLLPTGKVLLLGRKGFGSTAALLWDPATGTGRRVDPPENLFCAGHTILHDGRVVLAGGTLESAPDETGRFRGLDQIWIFDPLDETWRFQTRMAHGRWYPTTTLLPDGRVLILSGWDETGTNTFVDDVEVFTPSADRTGRGTVRTVPASIPITGLYPHGFILPNGKVLVTGQGQFGNSILDPATWTRTAVPPLRAPRSGYESGILVPGDPEGSWTAMLIGGLSSNTTVTASTEAIDASDPADGWSARAPLPQPRHNTNAVILPDGTVAVLGGNSGPDNRSLPQREALLYDPGADTWSPLADQAQTRTYHSTGLLLPDGRVLSAGDDGPAGGGDRTDAVEILSPPYLFRGARPEIVSSPARVDWGETFTVGATPADHVERVVLMAPGSPTHSFDMNQRHVELDFDEVDGALEVAAPPNANVAPNGRYMMFVLDDDGVPSVSRWITVGDDPFTVTPGAVPEVLERDPAAGAVGRSVRSDVVVDFTADMDPASVTSASFSVSPAASGTPVGGAITSSDGGRRVTFTPASPLAADTTYRVRIARSVRSAEGVEMASDQAWSFRTAAPGAPFVESGQKVVFEAEDYDVMLPRGGKSWTAAPVPTGFSGQRTMVAGPNTGTAMGSGYAQSATELRFPVEFAAAGQYRVWLRGWSANNGDDSIHVGLDGAEVPTAANITPSGFYETWVWQPAPTLPATITVPSAGLHTVNVWMREDGFRLDKVILSRDTAFKPAGLGPATSPRGSGDLTPPRVLTRKPAAGATDVPGATVVAATLDEVLAPASVTAASLTVRRAADDAPVAGQLSLQGAGTRVLFTPDAPLPGGVTYRATLARDVADPAGNTLGADDTWTFTTRPDPPTYRETSGQIVIEAENTSETVARSGRSWATVTAPAGFAGAGAVQALPNTGGQVDANVATTSPQVRFRAEFASAGDYFVWIRGYGATLSDDSVHAGLDGAVVETADRMGLSTRGSYTWTRATLDGPRAVIAVPSAGIHTVDLWMREDGMVVDRVLLTRNASFTPTGTGSAESPRN